MVTKKGPIKGSRIPVELPYAYRKGNEKRPIVAVKRPVAKYFGFDTNSLPFRERDNVNVKEGRKNYKRYSRGGFRGRSIKVIFSSPQKVGERNVQQVTLPLPNKTHISEVYDWLNNQASKFKLDKMITPDGITLPFTNT